MYVIVGILDLGVRNTTGVCQFLKYLLWKPDFTDVDFMFTLPTAEILTKTPLQVYCLVKNKIVSSIAKCSRQCELYIFDSLAP